MNTRKATLLLISLFWALIAYGQVAPVIPSVDAEIGDLYVCERRCIFVAIV